MAQGRKSKGPRFYPSRNGWYATVNGRTERLADGPQTKATENAAWEVYRQFAAAQEVYTDADNSPSRWVLNAYLRSLQSGADPVGASTFRNNSRYVNQFIALHGGVKWRELGPRHFTEWLDRQTETRRWNQGGRRLALSVLKQACNWACGEGHLTKHNPAKVAKAERHGTAYRPDTLEITEEEHRELLAFSLRRTNKDFACLLMLWQATGARPAEIALARADEWDEGKRGFVIEPTPENRGRYKLRRKGKRRVVQVPPHLVPLVRHYIQKRPTGYLFVNENGSPYTATTIGERFKNARDSINRKAGRQVIRPGVTAYSYRRGFVTRWLDRGLNPWKLADLLGTSLTMLEKHYSKLSERYGALYDELSLLD